MQQSRWMLLVILLSTPLISGSGCFVAFSSGGGSEDDENRDGLTVVVRTGEFVDAPVQGLFYVSGSISGFTDSDGRFEYEEGESVSFFIGDIALGNAVPGKSLVTPLDLVVDGDIDSSAVINIARLLQSLDIDDEENTITLPVELQERAVLTNELVSSAISYLDFADDPAFVNAASQLLAALTDDYPRTASLVDAEAAREHLQRTLARLATAQ